MLMVVSADERYMVEPMHVDELTLDPEVLNHWVLNRGLCSWFLVLGSVSFFNKPLPSLKKGPKPACILKSELGFGRAKIGLPTIPAVLWTYRDGFAHIPCGFVDAP